MNAPLQPEQIAQICHEANRRYCILLGDNSQKPWEETAWATKQSAIAGVVFVFQNPDAPLNALHENWYQRKKAEGWTFGEEKNDETKTHPCMRAYDDLPPEHRLKDRLFRSIVQTFMLPMPNQPTGDDHAD